MKFGEISDELDIFIHSNTLKVALGVSPQFFPIWIRVLNHNKYVEIKQFSKEDISNKIIFYRYFVNQVSRLSMRSAPSARKSGCLHICLHNEEYLITFLCVSIIRIRFNPIISDVHKELSSLRMKHSNRKYKLSTGAYTTNNIYY